MKIATIIPAYNEEKTIGSVIDVVKDHPRIDEVIVVSDGSRDRTAEIARMRNNVRVIELQENQGKGGALKVGVDTTDAALLLFLDADLLGLTATHLDLLLEPLLADEADMVVGIFKAGRVATDLALKVAPSLAGQRGLKRGLIDAINNLEMTRFGVEVALNNYVKKNPDIQISRVSLPDLTHMMKEEKMGFARGMSARLQMYWEIIKNIILRRQRQRN